MCDATGYVSGAIALCKNAIATMKWLKEKYDAKSFSPQEKGILAHAARTGIIQLVLCESLLAVHAGDKSFEGSDPAYRARYLDAFLSLCEKGLVVQHEGEVFCLNSKGFEIARELEGLREALNPDGELEGQG